MSIPKGRAQHPDGLEAMRLDFELAQVSHISPKRSDFRPSAALEALILRGATLANPLWADLGC
jgi:hypothetical protein